MNVDRIVLHHFMSHDDTDWKLNGARLVSLVGANGAGKSTLLDALAFCLFDAARGRTDDLVQLGESDMSARVEFTFAGERYAVERGRTRRAGGKSYLEFQVRDGDAWRPLTRESIRETQEAIAELLRMDASTFANAALLMQGRLNAFAEATAADRKRVLVQVLGLDVWARAEQLARGRARDLEARVAAERDQLARLETRLAERPDAELTLEQAIALLGLATDEIDTLEASQAAQVSKLAELDAKLAAGDAQRRLVEQLDARVAELANRFRDAKARRDTAAGAAERARAAIAAGAGATDAAAALPAARDEVARFEELRGQAADLEAKVRTRREAHAVASADARQAQATWSAQYTAARGRVDELTALLGALVPIPCPNCGTEVTPGREDLARSLGEASSDYRRLESSQPEEPLGLATEAAQIVRLESRRRDLGYDEAALAAAGAELRRLEALAARADAVADAETSLAEAGTAITEADAEIARISADGAAARDAVTEAQRELDSLEPFRAERSQVLADGRVLVSSIEQARGRLRSAQVAEAAAKAALEQLDRVAAERDQVAAAIATVEADVAVLHRLVAAFGVTGIPARIIEGAIPELEAHANNVLAQMRPEMTVSIRSQRAKKDGSGVIEALDLVVRDEVGERPLGMFSGGERMSVSLALAVALSRLVARRAGTAIRTLCIDEPDGLDVEARRALGLALRQLAHQGELERVILLSHHQDLADVADEVYLVSKNGHGSVVELVP